MGSPDNEKTNDDTQRLLERLRVHQEELEAQNDELRRGQTDLERSRNDNTESYQLAPVGYLTIDKYLKVIEGNLEITRLLNIDMKGLIYSHIFRFVPYESQLAFETHLALASQHGIDTTDLKMGRSDGPTFNAHIVTYAVLANDEVQKFRIVVEDFTERIWEEAALKKSERSLADAQRIAHIGSWEWNLQTGELSWSAELYSIYGVDPKSFVPTISSFADYIHPDDRELVNNEIQRVLSKATPVNFDFRIIAADGSIHILNTTGAISEFDESGKPRLMVG